MYDVSKKKGNVVQVSTSAETYVFKMCAILVMKY